MKKLTHLKAGESEYLASKDTEKKLPFSWLVAMTMAAERVAAKAMNLTKSLQRLLVFPILPSTTLFDQIGGVVRKI